jgi:hypothetical protein
VFQPAEGHADFGAFEPHDAYEAWLRKEHGLKQSFWSQVSGLRQRIATYICEYMSVSKSMLVLTKNPVALILWLFQGDSIVLNISVSIGNPGFTGD